MPNNARNNTGGNAESVCPTSNARNRATDSPAHKKFRIAVLACGALNCFAFGTVYLYGVFQPHIMTYYNANSAAASTPYTVMWVFMTVAQFMAGPLQKRFGVKAAAVLGLLLMGSGYFFSSLMEPHMIDILTVVFSVVVGLGLGIAYNTVAATVVRWFPDRKGVATSVSLGMMGGAGILLAPVFGDVLATQGLAFAFRCMAALFVPCILLTIAVFKDIPAGYMADFKPSESTQVQHGAHECRNIHDLVTTRDAWLLVLLYFSLVPTYLIVSAAFVSFGAEAKQLDPAVAVWFVSAASIVQIIGRFTVPSISDRIGRKAAFFGVFAFMAVATVLLVGTSGVPYALGFCALSFAYGGGVTAMPALVSDRLGSTNATQNIAFSELGTLLGSIATFGLVNSLSTGTSIACASIGACILGSSMLLAIYGPARKQSPSTPPS